MPISFEDFVDTLSEKTINSSEIYKNFLSEFRTYLDQNNLLSSWKYLLEIVNCASTIHEVHEQNVYMCPNTGGVYSHQRANFFGGYKWKNVKYIHEIKAVIVIEKGYENSYIRWNNSTSTDDDLISEAKKKISLWDYRKEEIKRNGIQVFLLDNPVEVNYRKVSKGGMFANKKYIWDIAKRLNAKNSFELAKGLEGKNWE